MDGWNTVWVAGLSIGELCPACQTVEEDLEAELDLVLNPSPEWRTLDRSNEENTQRYIRALIATYSTPKIMRRKADLLAAARPDAAELVRMMRSIADDMESGELYDDGRPADDRFAHCMVCEKPAPETVEQFTKWRTGIDRDTEEKVGVICPTCFEETGKELP